MEPKDSNTSFSLEALTNQISNERSHFPSAKQVI